MVIIYVSHNNPYIISSGMADATLFYCYLCRDGCVKHITINIVVLDYCNSRKFRAI